MSETPRRISDRIFDRSYMAELASRDTAELRSLREECEEIEAEVSYTRRLLQGKLDILRHELERRASGGDPDIQALVKSLPEILGDGGRGSVMRHMRVLVPRNAETQRREVERIASESTLAEIMDLSASELEALIARLKVAEVEVSEKRRVIQSAGDSVRAELVRRYREGIEDPSELLPS